MTGRSSRIHVFVTYRRADSAAYAGRLYDNLVDALGEANVFQDVSAIDPGEDFEVAIDGALDKADAVLVLIGPNWLTPGADGVSRLHDPDDYVHIEVSKSLARDIRVVPILVGGAELPSASELPDDLISLTHRQAVQLLDTDWRNDVDGLIRHLRGESPSKSGPALASMGERWGARGIDVAIGGVLLLAISGIDMAAGAAAQLPEGEGERLTTLATVALLIFVVAYDPLSTLLLGATPGKRALQLQVVRAEDHRPASVWLVGARGLILIGLWLCCVPGILDAIVGASHPLKQTWHDRMMATLVVHTPTRGRAKAPGLRPPA